MTAPVFVDTNVLLYARDAGETGKQPRAAAWLDHLWREQLGRTSFQVLSDYYVNVTRKLSPGLAPDEAWDDVRRCSPGIRSPSTMCCCGVEGKSRFDIG
jgi:predicted nucleic acid-binding protein